MIHAECRLPFVRASIQVTQVYDPPVGQSPTSALGRCSICLDMGQNGASRGVPVYVTSTCVPGMRSKVG